jgi:FAD:protein FMN transferase
MQTQRFPFEAMACGCEVVIAGIEAGRAAELAAAAIAEVQRIESKFSRYRSDSIVSRINAAAGRQAVECDDETWSLLNYADKLYQTSQGRFDITSGVLRRVWNFREPRVPSQAELAEVLRLIAWPEVELVARHVRLPRAGMELDFGGFGKEYAADRAASLISGLGVVHGYVNLGGDMRFIGPKPDGEPWVIGIQHPRKRGEVLATLPVYEGGLATSGDYERYFERDGQRYCHILDPRNGMPVSHWQTVSVMAPYAVVAGNCTTMAMLAQADGLELLQASGMKYLAVDPQGIVHMNHPAAS